MFKKILVILGLGIVLIGYQNCSENQFSAIPEVPQFKGGSTGGDFDIDDRDYLRAEVGLSDEEIDAYACASDEEDDRRHILVCHIPPGNPDERQTMCVSVAALPALTGILPTPLRDYVGGCGG